jgi:hypothetical protein
VFLSSFIIKFPKTSKRRSIEKKIEGKSIDKKEEGKRKAPGVSANQKEKSIF